MDVVRAKAYSYIGGRAYSVSYESDGSVIERLLIYKTPILLELEMLAVGDSVNLDVIGQDVEAILGDGSVVNLSGPGTVTSVGTNIILIRSSEVSKIRFTEMMFNTGVRKVIVHSLEGATNLKGMFEGSTSLEEVEILAELPGITNLENAFLGCTALTSVISTNTLKASGSMANMFKGCAALTCVKSSIDTTAATDKTDMFSGAGITTPDAAKQASLTGAGGDIFVYTTC